MTEPVNPAQPPPAPKSRWPLGLSGKLLLLTALFVLIAEVLIFVPSISSFRLMWLTDRLASAHTAALVLDAAPDDMVSEDLKKQLLDSIRARAVVMKMGDKRRLLAASDMPPETDHHVDVRNVSRIGAVFDALETMFSTSQNSMMRVIGPAPGQGDFIEIVLDEQPLREAMWQYAGNIFLISLAISATTGLFVYLTLLWMFVRPLRRLTRRLVDFGHSPEDPGRILAPSSRNDEIGIAERELSAMQKELADTLHNKSRLASLGLAVSKINHDLRNILASAQLMSDRLTSTADPSVRRLAPKLIATLGRAIAYCEQTLAYGRAQEPPPQRRLFDVADLLGEVRDQLDLGPDAKIGWVPSIERGLQIDADPDQLMRALVNLVKNSIEALSARAPNDPARDQIRIVGRREGSVVTLQVADTGPGLADRARTHLFEPFQGSSRRGGSGLGLVIVAELVRAHGGDIRLVDGTIGATFTIVIPDRPVALDERRAERARA